jgi:hypothetical protein
MKKSFEIQSLINEIMSYNEPEFLKFLNGEPIQSITDFCEAYSDFLIKEEDDVTIYNCHSYGICLEYLNCPELSDTDKEYNNGHSLELEPWNFISFREFLELLKN